MESSAKERSYAHAQHHRRKILYAPAEQPGFVAWTTAFDYANGSIGLVFKEVLRQHDPLYRQPRLEFSESVASPMSYASVTWGDEEQCAWRVYLRSDDNGQTYHETGRARENIASYANIGFPDGRIVGFHVPNVNDEGTAWGHYLQISESMDGGSTWTPTKRLLDGNAIYLWRVRRMQNGVTLVLASFYGSAWGPGHQRATRNTMLPDETYLSKITPFFLATTNGRDFTGPHYILPGTGAHEYDVVDTDEGGYLFITGDVQGTPPARQKVFPQDGGFVNSPLLPIRRGSPPDPVVDARGGFVPESIVRTPEGLLVGSRRNKPYTCSADEGENWYALDGLPPSLYQPFMLRMPNGTLANFGHTGGDHGFGQADMVIGVDYFTVREHLPRPCSLSLQRCLSADDSHYLNRYRARLTCGGQPVAGQPVVFQFIPSWNTPEENRTAPPENAPHTFTVMTDAQGYAEAEAEAYDDAADIHFAYTVQAFFSPDAGASLLPCQSPCMSVYALRPHRNNPFPYPAYLAEGILFLSPQILTQYPQAADLLAPFTNENSAQLPENALPGGLVSLLLDSRTLYRDAGGALRWRKSVHAPFPLAGVRPATREVYR